MTDNGYNLSDDGSCGFSGTGSQNNATLNLGPLADNVGPTQTHMPGAGSAAIDLIPSGTTISNNGVSYTCNQTGEPLDTDQRGQPRPTTAGGSCNAGAVEAADLSLAAPTLLAPLNGSTIADSTPTFDWDDVAGATQYNIQVDNNADFSSPEAESFRTTTAYTSPTLTDGTYYWRARAKDAAGIWSDWSEIWSLTIDATPPSVPALLLPSDGSITNDNTPTFDWDDVADAVQYHIQVDNNADFSSKEINTTKSVSTHTAWTPLADGTYYWHVRARDAAGNWSDYSAARTVEIDTVAPSVPALLLPSDGLITNEYLLNNSG